LFFAAIADFDLLDISELRRPFVGMAVVVLVSSLLVCWRIGARLRAHILLILWIAAYCFGVIVEANGRLDSASPRVYSAQVLGKSVSRGRHTTYRLRLSAWGNLREPNSVAVSRAFYAQVQRQQRICVALHPGALAISWYRLNRC